MFSEILSGARTGLWLWFETLIPTLLPFLLLSNFLIQSGIISRFISPSAYAVLSGFLFGFPAGAKIIASLYKNGMLCKEDAERLLPWCNNVSPVFLLSYYLDTCLDDKTPMYFTLLVCYGPAFILACYAYKKSKKAEIRSPRVSFRFLLFDACALDSSLTMLKLGCYVILFSICSHMVLLIPFLNKKTASLLCAALEISNGIPQVIHYWRPGFAVYLLLPLLSFGGICTIMQTGSAISDTPLSFKQYIQKRLFLSLFILLFVIILCIIKRGRII